MKHIKTFESFLGESSINEKAIKKLPSGIGFKESDVEIVVAYLNKKNTDDGMLDGNTEVVYTRRKGSVNSAHFGEKVDLKTTKAFYALYWGLQDLKKSDKQKYEETQNALTATGYNFKIYIGNLHFNSNIESNK